MDLLLQRLPRGTTSARLLFAGPSGCEQAGVLFPALDFSCPQSRCRRRHAESEAEGGSRSIFPAVRFAETDNAAFAAICARIVLACYPESRRFSG